MSRLMVGDVFGDFGHYWYVFAEREGQLHCHIVLEEDFTSLWFAMRDRKVADGRIGDSDIGSALPWRGGRW